MTSRETTIPVFKLYGENQAWPTPDLIHCESIPKRSSQHHWEIQLHQHADLYQLFYIQRGPARVEIEGQCQQIRDASIQVVPPLFVHGFQFPEDVDGYVLTMAAPLVAQIEQQLGSVLSSAGCYPVNQYRTHIDTLFKMLLYEYEGNEPARLLLMQSLVNALLVWVARQHRQQGGTESGGERGKPHLVSFNKLVEQHYKEHLSVDDYAHRIGVSATYLNNLCRRLAGHTALQIIHQRLLLEAKRNLIYTTMTVSLLSDTLGFTDPTYFSRFFRRLTGQSPNGFRRRGISQHSPDT